MQPWMYPINTHNQFAHILYNQNDDIDFISIKKNIKNLSYKEVRDHTLINCSFENFKNTIYQSIINLI